MPNPDLKIFISSHIPAAAPEAEGLFAVQAGAAISDRLFDGMLRDDTGENISAKNRDYCELTVMYWAWKNTAAEYYGFFHYRRYLSFDGKSRRLPYKFAKSVNPRLVKKLRLQNAAQFVSGFDVVLPCPEDMRISAREHYARSAGHSAEDLALIEKIISEKYPDYAVDAENYLSGTRQFFSNMFVMRKSFFFEYCEWLFDVLSHFDSMRTSALARADGFLAERLLGIWFFHKTRTEQIKYEFVQRVDILSYFKNPLKKSLVYLLLPPGSAIRAKIKKALKN